MGVFGRKKTVLKNTVYCCFLAKYEIPQKLHGVTQPAIAYEKSDALPLVLLGKLHCINSLCLWGHVSALHSKASSRQMCTMHMARSNTVWRYSLWKGWLRSFHQHRQNLQPGAGSQAAPGLGRRELWIMGDLHGNLAVAAGEMKAWQEWGRLQGWSTSLVPFSEVSANSGLFLSLA